MLDELSISNFTLYGILADPPVFPSVRAAITLAGHRFEASGVVDLSFILDAAGHAVNWFKQMVLPRVRELLSELAEAVARIAPDETVILLTAPLHRY